MKKLKSIVIFSAILTAMAVLFCINASAAEWKNVGDITYSIDSDTGVMVIKGEGGTIKTHMFGFDYCDYENCLVPHPGEFDDDPPSQTEIAVQNTKTLIIESGVKLEDGALSSFDNVETIILPDDITVIPAGLCAGLRNLKTVVLPYGVTKIKDDAFSYCKSLKNISIPSTVKTIGDYVFYDCNSDYVKIPDTVESVGEGNKFIPDCIDKVDVDIHGTYVYFTWNRVKDATDYRIFIRENGKWKKVEDVNQIPTNFKATEFHGYAGNLKPLTEYTFAIRPYNKTYGKPTYWAPKYIKVTVKTNLEDIKYKTASTKKGTAKITWQDIDNEQGYQIWYSTKMNSGYKKYSNFKANTTEATVTGFTSGKKYYFRVRAYKKVNGKYVYSNFYDTYSSVKIK